MIVVVSDDAPTQLMLDKGVPGPSLKWAEEGYVVVEIRESAFDRDSVLDLALDSLEQHEKCSPKGVVGLVAYGLGLWRKVQHSTALGKITAAAIYAGVAGPPEPTSSIIPTIQHLSGSASMKLLRTAETMQYDYPKMNSHLFALPTCTGFDYATEAISHSRYLTFLKKHMDGPYFDLKAIWDEHTYFEFVARSVEHTMSTMVQEPYVNHITTITGGIGREKLTNFYRDHIIFSNPRDIESHLISRTVGIDRVVDEAIMTIIFPGIPPTGLKLEIPYTAVVNIRGDRLYNEHLIWDQATVLKQLGLLPGSLPYPYSLPAGNEPGSSEFVVKLPVAGAEMAAKMRDKNAVPSNELITAVRRQDG
ncbi:LEA domain protein [Aspergillus aurantiobrunneus]